MDQTIYPIAIVGGGSAGVMALLRGVLNNDQCLFFPGTGKDRKKSRELWVAKVDNMPGYHSYSHGIKEPNLETLKWIEQSPLADNLIRKKNRGIKNITKTTEGLFLLEDNKGDTYLSEFVVLCTGVMDVQPLINGTIDDIFPYANLQSIDYCIRCDGHHALNKNTTIIGHEDSAGWIACLLHERYAPPSLTIMTHGKQPEFDESLLKLLELYNINIESETIVEIQGNEKEGLISGYKLQSGKVVETDFGFISLGMIVYNELAKGLGAELDERGFVITDNKGESSISKLYIAGDLRAEFKKQIYTAWDMAVDSMDSINRKIRMRDRDKLLAQRTHSKRQAS
jgi:thioredoxin reductase (NADPH)